MKGPSSDGSRGGRRWAAGAAVLACVALGALSVVSPGLALIGAVVTAAAAVATGGVAPLLLVAFPAVFVARRLGPAGLDISVADIVLVGAAFAAIPFVPWHNPHVRRVAMGMGAYLALLFLTVIASPSQRALFEWAHRASFLFGGLTVGAAVAHLGRTRLGLRLFLLATVVVSVAAVPQSFRVGFAPAYPLGLHKNFAGALLAMGVLCLLAAPRVLGLSRRGAQLVGAVLLIGLLATQSRGAIAALFAAVAIWSTIRQGRAARAVVLVPAAALVLFAILLTVQADNDRQTNFGSTKSRRISYEAALKAWRKDPIFGSGLRYYKAPGYRFDVPSFRDSYVEPHSVWYSTLGESGLVGLGALAVLIVWSLWSLRLAGGPLAFAAGLVIVAKLVHGMVDIYWVAGTQTLPWLLVGLAVVGRSHLGDSTIGEFTTDQERPALIAP